MPTTRSKHFSMIRGFHLADFLRSAMRLAASRAYSWRCNTSPARRCRTSTPLRRWRRLAFVFDVLDGRIARCAADSFGARPRARFAGGRDLLRRRPAALAFAAGLDGGWDVDRADLLRVLRREPARALQRDREALSEGADKVQYFEGTPIPTSVVLTGVLAFAAWQGRLGEQVYWGAWTSGPGRCTRWRCCSCCPDADDQQDFADSETVATPDPDVAGTSA